MKKIVCALLACALLPAGIAAVAAVSTPAGNKAADARAVTRTPLIRRIVTSENAAGKSYVLADGTSANVTMLNGSRVNRLWESAGLPAAIPATRDQGATAANAYRPGFAGTSLYVADIPPGSGLNDIPMHKANSTDYIVLLQGRIDLVLDDGKHVPMRPGEVLIQTGNNHSWTNPGPGVARLLNVTITAQRAGGA